MKRAPRRHTKGTRSVTHPGDEDYTSKRGSTVHHIDGHDVREKRAPFAKRDKPRIRSVVKPRRHAPHEDEAERHARGEHTTKKRAPRKKYSWHKGERSRTKDEAGDRHIDGRTHKGDRTYHRGGHDEDHRQGTTKRSKPFKSVAEAHKVVERLRGKTKNAEELRHLRRAVAYKNAHARFGKRV